MKYLLKIIDTENDKVLVERNTDCIIVAAHCEKDTCANLISKCTTEAIIDTYHAILLALEDIESSNPIIAKIAKLIKEEHEQNLEEKKQ